jgi:hypothetical protein
MATISTPYQPHINPSHECAKAMMKSSWIQSSRRPIFPIALLAATITTIGLPSIAKAESTGLTVTCAYDPNTGKPNPLGMRAYVTILEVNGDSIFTFEQFPSNVANKDNTAATIEQQRKLTFYSVPIQKARELMLKNSSYYEELLGYKPEANAYKALDDLFVCKRADGSTIGTGLNIESLPNGQYRYWSGKARTEKISDEELLKQGGVLYVFEKKGNRVIGNLSQIDGEAGVCVEGVITGNTVSGLATSYQPQKEINATDDFIEWGSPDGVLKVRRGKAISGNRVRYASALLNLSTYSKINPGKGKPPTSCPK